MMNKKPISSIFPDIEVDPAGWEFYELPTSLDLNFQELENDLFSNPITTVIILKNIISSQYIVMVREIGVYNSIFKGQITIGHTPWNYWRNCIHIADDGSVWNDIYLNQYRTHLSLNIIRSNEMLLRSILESLYDLLFTPKYNELLNRIDELLLELHESNTANDIGAGIIQKFIDLSVPNGEKNTCPAEIQLEGEDIKKD